MVAIGETIGVAALCGAIAYWITLYVLGHLDERRDQREERELDRELELFNETLGDSPEFYPCGHPVFPGDDICSGLYCHSADA